MANTAGKYGVHPAGVYEKKGVPDRIASSPERANHFVNEGFKLKAQEKASSKTKEVGAK